MMNQGSSTATELDSQSTENYQVADANQAQLPVYSSYHVSHLSQSTTGSTSAQWSLPRTSNDSTENGFPLSSGYNHDQQNGPSEQQNSSSYSSTSSGFVASGAHDYASYTSYPTSSDPYGYGSGGYQGHPYYNSYQDQTTNHPYSHQAGAYQTSGAPYQTYTSSFQSTGSYVAPSSYSGTYYNAGGDYQTTGGGYQNSSYSGQTNLWHDANYGNYHHHYPHYAPSDSNGTQNHGSSAAAAPSVEYQQHYKQWADYYSQCSSDVSCAPGTENIPVTTSTTTTTTTTTTTYLECPIPGVSGGYPVASSQPPPPGTTPRRLDGSSSELPSFQVAAAVSENHDNSWKNMSSGFSNSHFSNPSSYFHKPPEPNTLQEKSFECQQTTLYAPPQVPAPQCPTTNQVHPQSYLPQFSASTLDTCRTSNIQMPTNPRIASGLALGTTKADKDTFATDTLSQPAYISVSIPEPNLKTSTSGSSADTVLKPGAFPASLRAYVERTLARCKDDSQKAVCQNIMKEIITKASADGTLFTRNWDIEPLFPLPVANLVKDQVHSPILSSLSKYKKSPSKRTKSRWEPLPEDKLVEKLASVNYDPIKDVCWDYSKERERVVDTGKSEGKDEIGSHMKVFFSANLSYQSKSTQRPVKKPRFGDDDGSSSGSDKEQGLTSYYAASMNLANSPEERKKRENRFKRFDKGHEVKAVRHKGVGAGNLYSRRTTALLMSKRNEEGQSRAVEDMDWDALTVKGTCQEIEKRYLRLTSAPDPATVRPGEVLEKALVMVQSSNKNYLYKCDQLKSIRQDLTVQRIRNELTVKVYETHARLALEAVDLPEYNQCQSQLKTLYSEGIKGCYMEFTAYSLLCVILHSNNNRDLLSSMARLSVEAKGDEVVKHALEVRSAVTSGNYVLFFRLYKTAPYLSTCLMDLYVEKMRFDAVRCMSRSYRPTVPVAFIAQVLGFLHVATAELNDEKETDRVEECEEWLRAHGASIILDNNGEKQLDTKASSFSLYMPEPEDAVAHGDANLAVNDFFTRTT
ncbi:SAC3 family protein A-like isoform X2 [Aristolochia californica]|uniref:SAC3 family protein A-like isoform X2 n=1 Tax=Aristolochia californica TaxID=171875 RepID=UPI0035E183AF